MVYPAEAVQATIEGLISALCERAGQPVDTLVFSCLGTAMLPTDAAGAHSVRLWPRPTGGPPTALGSTMPSLSPRPSCAT